MTYQVLARKWRPRIFSEMVGQEHVLRAIINALDNDRLHHAFLFTGTRGVGKTTIARILAKSLNCEQGVSSTPCGQCSACTEIDEGRFLDLIEVDAASRTKVEDTRELLENVQYAPTRGRYKVYLIDEVHMLSKHSFNALLKTLEEPPPHVKFLLATTDPQKLPVTVLSRCLQFNLKRMPQELISGHLSTILGKEKIEFDAPALMQLAHSADGSMRDALSLLDQAIAYGGGTLREAEVCAMLGTIDRSQVFAVLEALASGDGKVLLDRIAVLAELSPDYATVLDELLALLHRIALAHLVPDAVDDSQGDREQVMALQQLISAEDTQLYYQIALIGRRDFSLVPDARSALEMVLIRMLAFKPGATQLSSTNKGSVNKNSVNKSSTNQSTANQGSVRQNSTATRSMAQPVPAVPAAKTPAAAAQPEATQSAVITSIAADTDWAQLIELLPLPGMVKAMANHCVLDSRDDSLIVLTLDEAHKHFCSKGTEKKLELALQQQFGDGLKLKINIGVPKTESPAKAQQRKQDDRQRQAEDSIENDNAVHALQEKFNATLVPDSIQPID